MSTEADKIIELGKKLDAVSAKLDTLIATGINNAPVLAAIAGVQSTANAILAQDLPTPISAPVLTALNLSSGSIAGGETVTATGTGFEGTTAAMVGTVAAANYVVINDTTATYTSPAQGAGPEDVTIVGPGGTSAVVPAGVFTYS